MDSRSLQRLYLALAAVGYAVPGFVMIRESIRSGNILFWTKPDLTTAELFANGTSTAFALDLFGVVVVALLWMTVESRRLRMRDSVALSAKVSGGGRLWLRQVVACVRFALDSPPSRVYISCIPARRRF